MKKVLNWFKERNNWHYILGAILAAVVYIVAFEAFQIIGRVLISGIIVLFGSTIWEMFWEDYKKYKFDKNDIKRSMIGWFIGISITVITHLLIK